MNEKQLVDKWIKELETFGFSHDEMIGVFRLARLKFDRKIQFICPKCKSDQTYANAGNTIWICLDCKNKWGKLKD